MSESVDCSWRINEFRIEPQLSQKVRFFGRYTAAIPRPVSLLRLVLTFREPIPFFVEIRPIKWFERLGRYLGKEPKGAIATSKPVDSAYVAYGDHKAGTTALVSLLELLLVEFGKNKMPLLHVPGNLTVNSQSVVYTEGPYLGRLDLSCEESNGKVRKIKLQSPNEVLITDLEAAAANITEGLVKVAQKIESLAADSASGSAVEG